MPKTVEDRLTEARAIVDRVTAVQAHAELADGALLIDVRTSQKRTEHGDIPALSRSV